MMMVMAKRSQLPRTKRSHERRRSRFLVAGRTCNVLFSRRRTFNANPKFFMFMGCMLIPRDHPESLTTPCCHK